MGLQADNYKSRNLLRALTDNHYDHLSTGQPTYWPTDPRKLPDLLDFFVVNGIPTQNCLLESHYDLTSDHTPVIVNLNSQPINTNISAKLASKHTNWENFCKYMNENLSNQCIKEPKQLDEAVKLFTTTIQQAAWQATPSTIQEVRNSMRTPLHLRHLITEKRRARRI